MKQFSPSLQVLALFCFLMAFHLSLGQWLQRHYGMFGIMADQVGILLLPTLFFSFLMGHRWKILFPWKKPSFQDFLIILLLTSVAIASTEILLSAQSKIIPPPQLVQQFYEELLAHPKWSDVYVQVVVLAIVPAFCEEMVFRGFLQGVLTQEFSSKKAILITSIAFAGAHLNPWYFPFYFLLGIFFSGVRQWKNNLTLCFLAHLLHNLYSLFRPSIT